MKILIIGCNGQLGYDVVSVLEKRHHILAKDLPEIDIRDLSCLEDIMHVFRPQAVVNCAAFTQVDRCETEKETAWKVNVKGTENIARTLKKYNAQLIHISTDYVFDGKKDYPKSYNESDKPSPISVYGRTKLEGERVIINSNSKYAIMRTSWLYGINGNNFLKTILRLSITKSEQQIKVVNDQHGSPTWSYRLASQIESVIEKGDTGVFHAAGEGDCTWYQFAKYFLERMGLQCNLIPCTTSEYPTAALRPTNSILTNARLTAEKNNLMVDWRKDINEFVDLYRHTLIKEAESWITK